MYDDRNTELLDYWLTLSRFWRTIVVAPIIQMAEEAEWPDDSKACRRWRSLLLNPDVMVVALRLYRAEKGRIFSARELSCLIAEEDTNIAEGHTSLARDKARKRINRVVKVLKAYQLIESERFQRGRIVHYEISATDKLHLLVEWLMGKFPPAPRSLPRQPDIRNEASDQVVDRETPRPLVQAV